MRRIEHKMTPKNAKKLQTAIYRNFIAFLSQLYRFLTVRKIGKNCSKRIRNARNACEMRKKRIFVHQMPGLKLLVKHGE